MLLGLLKLARTVFSLSVSILSTLGFQLPKFDFAAKLVVSTPVVLFKSVFDT